MAIPEKDIIDIAIDSLGLNEFHHLINSNQLLKIE